MQPKISVIIPTYNSAGYLPLAIESVFNQSYGNVEIIIVDDGSTDNTQEIVKPFLERVAYYRKENGGPSSARNHGIRKSTGDYIAFLDSDDRWLPEKLELQLNIFIKNGSAGLVGCGITNRDEEGKFLSENRMAQGKLEFSTRLIFSNIIAAGSTLMISRDVVGRIGLFDEELLGAEDWDYGLRVFKEYDIYFVEKPLVLKTERGAGQSACGNGDLMLSCELKFLEKHRDYFERNFDSVNIRKAFARRYFSHTYAMLRCGEFFKARKSITRSIRYYPMYIFNRKFLLYLYKSFFNKVIFE